MTTTDMASSDPAGIRAVLDAGATLADPIVFDVDTDPQVYVAVVPNGYSIKQLTVDTTELQDRPRRKRGTVVVRDTTSWVQYWLKHATPTAEAYADAASARITGVLNANGGTDGSPEWGDHQVVLQLTRTPAFARWVEASGKWQSQHAFAEFIEQSLPEIQSPDAATMLELAQTFEATTGVEFQSSQRLSSSERRLVYRETIDAKAGQAGQIDVPTELSLLLQPYRGGPVVNVRAWFRYRIRPSGLELCVVLDRVDDVLDVVFTDLSQELTDAIDGTPILQGSPPRT